MLLPVLIFIPFISGLICWQIKSFRVKMPRWIALIAMNITLLFSMYLWMKIDYSINWNIGMFLWKAEFFIPWIPRFGISFHLALDGLSLIMVILTSFLGIMAVLCSWNETKHHQEFFYSNLLWILGSVIGIFLSADMFLFFFFWEMMLVPMYFLISICGHEASDEKTRIISATKFFIYTQASGLIMLAAILGLVFIHYYETGIWTFNYKDLLQISMSHVVEYLIMLGFFIAFAIKMPIVPFHGWLSDTHSQSPTAGSVDLAGILSKTGAYGLLRFSLPMFPNASAKFAPFAMWLGIISIFYGAWMAFSQTDIKRLIAYSSISHMGFIMVAIYSGHQIALQGVVLQIISHSLSISALFILCGQLYERLHTRDIRDIGGMWMQIKWIPSFFLFFSIANLGIPGTGNFIGELMILIGSFLTFPNVVFISAFGLVFASIYSLFMIKRIYYETPKSKIPIHDMSLREFIMIITLLVFLLLLGIYPQPILNTSNVAIQNIHQWYTASILNNRIYSP